MFFLGGAFRDPYLMWLLLYNDRVLNIFEQKKRKQERDLGVDSIFRGALV